MLTNLNHSQTYTAKSGSKILWMPESSSALSLGAIRYIQPKSSQEVLTSLLLHGLTQSADTNYLRELAKSVRAKQGTLRYNSSPTSLGALIQTHQVYGFEQFLLLNRIFKEPECTQEEFSAHQSACTQTLVQSNHNADVRLRLLTDLSSYQACAPYLSKEKDLMLDIGTLGYEDFQSNLDSVMNWPVVYFLFGGDDRLFSQIKNVLDQEESQSQIGSEPSLQETPLIQRHLSEDPEAAQVIGFALSDIGVESQWNMELLYSLIQNRMSETDTKVCISHYENQCVLGFEKTLPITEIALHMETMWKIFLDLSHTPPSKSELHQALYFAKTRLAEVFRDADSLYRHLLNQKGFILFSDYVSYVENFHHVDVANWMNFVKGLFQFDRQRVIEIVPQVYGQGASSELRMESLKKRLGIKKEETQNFLADQYVFPPLTLFAQNDEKAQYAHAIPLNSEHMLMVNINPSDGLAHLTVYFEGGRRYEHEKNAGVTQLLAMSMIYGSSEKKNIISQMQCFGVEVEIENTADFFGFHFTMHPSLVSKMIPKITDLIFKTEFSEVFVNEQKLRLLKEQMIKQKENFFRSVELFYQSMFGIHGYGQPRLGSQSSVLNISQSQIEQTFRQDIIESNSTLWILTSPQAHDDVALELSKRIPSQVNQNQTKAQLFSMFPKKQFKVTRDTQSSNHHSICMGLKTVNIKDHRQYYLDIMQIYLSGTGGKLSDALIDKLNLVDTVKAYHVHLLQAGVFFIQLHSKQAQDASLFEYLQTIFTSFTTVLPSTELLDSAKELAVLRAKHRLHQPRELSYDIGSRHFAGVSWEDPRGVEGAIKKTSPSELTNAMNDLMDYDSFAMGIC